MYQAHTLVFEKKYVCIGSLDGELEKEKWFLCSQFASLINLSVHMVIVTGKG